MPNASKIGAGRVYIFTRLTSAGWKRCTNRSDALVHFFVVDPDGLEHVAQLVAQDALHDVEIVMEQHRRRLLLGLLPDVQPQVVEERHVAGDLFFGAAFARRAHNEAARDPGAVRLQNPLQAQALFVARDLARDADVLERRHVDHEAARQGDVRRDARALLAERLLRDLDDDFLAFLQQVADRRQR